METVLQNTDEGSVDSAWESLSRNQSAREFSFLGRGIEFTKKKNLSKEIHQMWRQEVRNVLDIFQCVSVGQFHCWYICVSRDIVSKQIQCTRRLSHLGLTNLILNAMTSLFQLSQTAPQKRWMHWSHRWNYGWGDARHHGEVPQSTASSLE